MLTLEQAKTLKHGDVLHYKKDTGVWKLDRQHCTRWRVNGKVKTWKRDAGRIEVPLKHGLKDYGYLTENYLKDFHPESECPWRKFEQAVATNDLTVLPTLIGIDDALDEKIAKVLSKG